MRKLSTIGAAAALALVAAIIAPVQAHEGHETYDPHAGLHQELGNQHEWEHRYLEETYQRFLEYHPYASARQRRQFRAHLARAHAHNHRALNRIHESWHYDRNYGGQ
jgi:hypothetical protein